MIEVRVTIQATDPAFRADLEAWTRRLGHTLEDLRANDAGQ